MDAVNLIPAIRRASSRGARDLRSKGWRRLDGSSMLLALIGFPRDAPRRGPVFSSLPAPEFSSPRQLGEKPPPTCFPSSLPDGATERKTFESIVPRCQKRLYRPVFLFFFLFLPSVELCLIIKLAYFRTYLPSQLSFRIKEPDNGYCSLS